MNPQFGMGMPMNFGMIQPQMSLNPMGGMNPSEDEEWLKGFQMGVDEVNNLQQQQQAAAGPKVNVVFKTTQGSVTNMVFDYVTPVDRALAQYLKRVGKPELIGNLGNEICFLFNANHLKFGNQTKVEVFFKGVFNPKVVVNDTKNVIGA